MLPVRQRQRRWCSARARGVQDEVVNGVMSEVGVGGFLLSVGSQPPLRKGYLQAGRLLAVVLVQPSLLRVLALSS